MPLISSLQTILKPYHTSIEQQITEYISQNLPESQLREAFAYALGHGGKRFRPALVLMLAEALGNRCDVTLPALTVEFFHTASLIADDLPCMDNDDLRRGAPSLHRAFDEATALLTSYALIAEGYTCLFKAVKMLQQSQAPHASRAAAIGLLAIENASQNTGIAGAAGGQYLDLFVRNPDPHQIQDIIIKKTVSLFEIALVLGWLFGGGPEEQLPTVKAMAYHLGMAFQIADDLSDYAHDQAQETTANIAAVCGISSTYEKLENELIAFEDALKELNLASSPLTQVAQLLRVTARLALKS